MEETELRRVSRDLLPLLIDLWESVDAGYGGANALHDPIDEALTALSQYGEGAK
jgi:hypothetical protein